MRATRGYGLLENYLAKRRAKMADRLIPNSHRNGRILDIGCGACPLFLLSTEFSEKYGLDKRAAYEWHNGLGEHEVHLVCHDIERDTALPFDRDQFDVLTMLAVLEHIDPGSVPAVMQDVHRVLKPGGVLVLTTPAAWADKMLRIMARMRLVSPAEIEDHKAAYHPLDLARVLRQAGFGGASLRVGHFEMRMNLWAAAQKAASRRRATNSWRRSYSAHTR